MAVEPLPEGTSPGWYWVPGRTGLRGEWDGAQWVDFLAETDQIVPPAETGSSTEPSAEQRRDGDWIQDPDGNWHPKPRPRISMGGWFAIIMVVAALVGGGIFWNWKSTHDAAERENQRFACELLHQVDC